MSDPAGKLAVEKLDVQIGSQERLAISLTGDVSRCVRPAGSESEFYGTGPGFRQISTIRPPGAAGETVPSRSLLKFRILRPRFLA